MFQTETPARIGRVRRSWPLSTLSHEDRSAVYGAKRKMRVGLFAFATLMLTCFMAVTTIGFFDRIVLLIEQQRFGTLIGYLGVCAICWFCLLIAAIQPGRLVRWFWAIALSVSVAASQAYYLVSSSELGPFDVLSLWQASHEAGRAASHYGSAVGWFAVVFLVSCAGIALFPTPGFRVWARHGAKLAWLPVVPVLLIGGIVLHKEGSGAQGLPQHFAPLAVGGVTLAKSALQPGAGERRVPARPASEPAVRNIVMLIDESVRGDYVSLTPGNIFTPKLAARKQRIVDFGAAASGGNCSHYSNALIRFGASRDNIAQSVKTNPSIWQYAKAAGFRTVFIDAQAGVNKNASRLQNFMTVKETAHIDRFVTFDDVATPDLDQRLMAVVQQELAGADPVFVYANKNGAHFPYQHGYRESRSMLAQDGADQSPTSKTALIRSYINNIRWNVDGVLSDFLDAVDLRETLVLYTSDHGQNFDPDRLTHCSIEDADPREGLVPMMAMTDDGKTLDRLRDAARRSFNRTSHFQLVPSVLDMMGYTHDEIAEMHGQSVFGQIASTDAEFTTGDIFGLFRAEVRRSPIDLSQDYLEQETRRLAASGAAVSISAADALRPSYRQ